MTSPPEYPQSNEPTQPLLPPPHQTYRAPQQPYGAMAYPPQQPPFHGYAPQPTPNGMYQAAAIINWVMLGIIIVSTCGFGVIAAAWFVPMTLNIHKGAKDREKHTALGVCTLIFCNLISGILMLVEDNNRPSRPTY